MSVPDQNNNYIRTDNYPLGLSSEETITDTLPKIDEKKQLTDISNIRNPYIAETAMNWDDYTKRGFTTKQNWEKQIFIKSKIISFDKKIVTCECLIDKEKKIFQRRSFSFDLFSHLKGLSIPYYVTIRVSSRSGSQMIEVFSSDESDEKLFGILQDMDELSKSDIFKPSKHKLKF